MKKTILFGIVFMFLLSFGVIAAPSETVFENGTVELVFTSNDVWTPPSYVRSIDVVVVGGGGGSGCHGRHTSENAGGAGAGGLIYIENYRVYGETDLTVTIGAGGAGGTGCAGDYGGSPGGQGGSTVFGDLLAYGGGYSRGVSNGNSGGSGGGAGTRSTGTIYSAGASTQPTTNDGYENSGFGNAGGRPTTVAYGGGGGGAGSAGASLITKGAGMTIWGRTLAYGGFGAYASTPGGYHTAGPANTGAGASARSRASNGVGYAGGSGIVIVRYGPKIIQSKNRFSDDGIETFNVTITNSTDTTTYSTTNGTIIWGFIEEELLNITIEAEDYLDRTYTDYNISEGLEAELTQATLTLSMSNLFTSVKYDNVQFNITNTDLDISETYTTSNLTYNHTFNVSAGNYTFTGYKVGYPVGSGSVEILSLENAVEDMGVGFEAQIVLYDEFTLDPFDVNSTNGTYVSVICSNIGTYNYEFDEDYRLNITIPCTYTKLKFVTLYDEIQYTRTLLSEETDAFELNAYLIDLITTQSIVNSFVFNDYLGEYQNPRIFIRKDVEGARITVHSNVLDIENKITTYLIENDDYTLELYSDNRPKLVLGIFGADTVGTKEITLSTADIDISAIDSTSFNVYSYASNGTGNLTAYLGYTDPTLDTTSITWTITYLNNSVDSERTLFHTHSVSGITTSFIGFTKIMDELANKTKVWSTLEFTRDGEEYTQEYLIYEVEHDWTSDTIFGYFTVAAVQWAIILLLSTLALLGTMTTQTYVNYIFIGAAAVFAMLDILNASITVLLLALLLNVLFHLRKAEEVKIL